MNFDLLLNIMDFIDNYTIVRI